MLSEQVSTGNYYIEFTVQHPENFDDCLNTHWKREKDKHWKYERHENTNTRSIDIGGNTKEECDENLN